MTGDQALAANEQAVHDIVARFRRADLTGAERALATCEAELLVAISDYEQALTHAVRHAQRVHVLLQERTRLAEAGQMANPLLGDVFVSAMVGPVIYGERTIGRAWQFTAYRARQRHD